MDKSLSHLFQNNFDWSNKKKADHSSYFQSQAETHKPKYLWIGCSDSRVPPNSLLNLEPGELFVHRNIANLVIEDDLSCLSVLQYAIEALKVEHIILCGHYGCGGVYEAMQKHSLGIIDGWLKHIQNIETKYQSELSNLNPQKKWDQLSEYVVREQVQSLLNNQFVKQALDKGQALTIHGWIYDLREGILKRLVQQ